MKYRRGISVTFRFGEDQYGNCRKLKIIVLPHLLIHLKIGTFPFWALMRRDKFENNSFGAKSYYSYRLQGSTFSNKHYSHKVRTFVFNKLHCVFILFTIKFSSFTRKAYRNKVLWKDWKYTRVSEFVQRTKWFNDK